MGKGYRSDAIYQNIVSETLNQLALDGSAEWETIVDKCGLQNWADAISWTAVHSIIQEDHKARLIAVTPRFFHRRSRTINPEQYHPDMNPEKFLALGNGKRAAGWVSVTGANGSLVVHRLKLDQAQIDGRILSIDKMRLQAISNGLLPGDERRSAVGFTPSEI